MENQGKNIKSFANLFNSNVFFDKSKITTSKYFDNILLNFITDVEIANTLEMDELNDVERLKKELKEIYETNNNQEINKITGIYIGSKGYDKIKLFNNSNAKDFIIINNELDEEFYKEYLNKGKLKIINFSSGSYFLMSNSLYEKLDKLIKEFKKFLDEIFDVYGRPIMKSEFDEAFSSKFGFNSDKWIVVLMLKEYTISMEFGYMEFIYKSTLFEKLLIKFTDMVIEEEMISSCTLINKFVEYLIELFNLRDISDYLLSYEANYYIQWGTRHYRFYLNDGDPQTFIIDILRKYKEKYVIKAEKLYYNIDKYDAKKIEEEKKILYTEICDLLQNYNKLELSDLILELNLSTKTSLKPINSLLIKNIIEKNPNDFSYDENTKIISLKTDDELIELLKNHFENKTEKISTLTKRGSENGILAVIFTGKDFPIEEAINYVKTRPIIFVDNISNDIDLYDYLNLEHLKIENNSDNDLKYLKALLPQNINYNEWLNENCIVSFFPISKERIQTLMPKVIKHFSPVLNLNRNPNNLFEFTIKQKVEEYLKNLNG